MHAELLLEQGAALLWFGSCLTLNGGSIGN
jgi:hypothetical protein